MHLSLALMDLNIAFLILIDGTHLYRKYKGKLLTTIGIDGNNQLIPLAFTLVEEENIDSWSWFMGCIRH